MTRFSRMVLSGLVVLAHPAFADCPDAAPGITLPSGFCATVFADDLGHPRHMIVAADGTLYVNTWSGGYYPNDKPREDGYIVALRDGSRQRFGPTGTEGGTGGTGIALFEGWLYVEAGDSIVRYRLQPGSAVPTEAPETIVAGLPLEGEHPMHQFVIDERKGDLFVNVGSLSNACEHQLGDPHSPGFAPCTELETRAGIWRFDARKTGQTYSAAARYATGIRNIGGMQIDEGRLFVTQHGRDRFVQSWPELYDKVRSAELPAEELLEVRAGGDYGWPFCYFDGFQEKLVLAPEYGGDGGKKIGVCADKLAPAAFFPAHWAPNDLLFYRGTAFPEAYRHGVFIAFHGSWNRAPMPQAGFRLVFQPLKDGKAAGRFRVFADGFPGRDHPDKTAYRPTGLATAPDGALYVSDDNRGRVWKIVYRGPAGAKVASAARPVYAPAPEIVEEGVANLPLPPGIGRAALGHGARIFSGEEQDGTCSGCHGADGTGTAFGADLTQGSWHWSDGSVKGIAATIRAGVANPRNHPGAMPPMGGAALSPDDLTALAGYVWALAHAKEGKAP